MTSYWEKFKLYYWHASTGEVGTFNTPTRGRSTLKYPPFLRMFQKQNDESVWAVEDALPFDDVISRMRDYAEPVYMEYKELNDNFAFARIQADFFQFLFWNNYIYVLYIPEDETLGTLASFSIYDTEPLSDGTFATNKFYNLITHETDTIRYPEFLIKVMWDGQQAADRLNRWFKVAHMMALNEQLFSSRMLLGHKYLMTTYSGTTNKTKQHIQNDRNLLYNLSPTINMHRVSDALKSEPREITLVSAVDAHGWLSAAYFYLDRELSELGRVANLNHKGERLTAGENYKDIYAIKNRQAAVLDQLNIFSAKLIAMYGEFAPDLLFDLRFKEEPATEPQDNIEEPTANE